MHSTLCLTKQDFIQYNHLLAKVLIFLPNVLFLAKCILKDPNAANFFFFEYCKDSLLFCSLNGNPSNPYIYFWAAPFYCFLAKKKKVCLFTKG